MFHHYPLPLQRLARDKLLERFRALHPKNFDSVSEPGNAKQWLRGMHTIFNALGCKEEDKKTSGVFQLTYFVAEWWEAEKTASCEEAIGRLSWLDFKTKFLGKYSLDLENEKKEKEFIDLMQGTRIVQICPAHSGYSVKRNKRYVRGLSKTIQGHMMNLFEQSFKSIVEHATNLEYMYGTSQ